MLNEQPYYSSRALVLAHNIDELSAWKLLWAEFNDCINKPRYDNDGQETKLRRGRLSGDGICGGVSRMYWRGIISEETKDAMHTKIQSAVRKTRRSRDDSEFLANLDVAGDIIRLRFIARQVKALTNGD